MLQAKKNPRELSKDGYFHIFRCYLIVSKAVFICIYIHIYVYIRHINILKKSLKQENKLKVQNQKNHLNQAQLFIWKGKYIKVVKTILLKSWVVQGQHSDDENQVFKYASLQKALALCAQQQLQGKKQAGTQSYTGIASSSG